MILRYLSHNIYIYIYTYALYSLINDLRNLSEGGKKKNVRTLLISRYPNKLLFIQFLLKITGHLRTE